MRIEHRTALLKLLAIFHVPLSVAALVLFVYYDPYARSGWIISYDHQVNIVIFTIPLPFFVGSFLQRFVFLVFGILYVLIAYSLWTDRRIFEIVALAVALLKAAGLFLRPIGLMYPEETGAITFLTLLFNIFVATALFYHLRPPVKREVELRAEWRD